MSIRGSDEDAEAVSKSTTEELKETPFLPVVYMITPTYTRLTQKADLTRLCFTLMHVPKIHWIVVEDSDERTSLVTELLSGKNSCKLPRMTHLEKRTRSKKKSSCP